MKKTEWLFLVVGVFIISLVAVYVWGSVRGAVVVKQNVSLNGIKFNKEQIKQLVKEDIIDESGKIVDLTSPIGALVVPNKIIVLLSQVSPDKKYMHSYVDNGKVYGAWLMSIDGEIYNIEISYDSDYLNQWDLESRKIFIQRLIYEVDLTMKQVKQTGQSLTENERNVISQQLSSQEGFNYAVVD